MTDATTHRVQEETVYRRERPSLPTVVVAVVVSALVVGTLNYVGAFIPTFGVWSVYLPAAVLPVLAVWFGGWGVIGIPLGLAVSQLPLGFNPLIWPAAALGNALMPLLAALFYRKPVYRGWRQLLIFYALLLAGHVAGGLLVAFNFVVAGFVPANVAYTAFWPAIVVGDMVIAAVFAPLILRYLSPYVVKSGLYFPRFF